MNYMFVLPDSLLVALFTDWVCMYDMVRLDGSAAEERIRTHFLSVAYAPKTVYRTHLQDDLKQNNALSRGELRYNWNVNNSVTAKLMTWAMQKNAAVTAVTMTNLLLLEKFTRKKYLEAVGVSVTHILNSGTGMNRSDDSRFWELVRDELFKYCPNVTTFQFPNTSSKWLSEDIVRLHDTWPNLQEVTISRGEQQNFIRASTEIEWKCLRSLAVNDAYLCIPLPWDAFFQLHGHRIISIYSRYYNPCMYETITKHCPNLQSFTALVVGALPQSITALAQGCPQLHNVNFLESSTMHYTAIQAAALFGGRLTVLRLPIWQPIDIGTVHTVVRQCINLQQLIIACKVDVCDTVYTEVGRHCRNMRELRLTPSTGVSDVGLCALAAECPELRRADISHSQVTDTGLTALLTACPRLVCLYADGCLAITDASQLQLPQSCLHIRHLQLQDCSGVTLCGLRAVVTQCRQLEVLSVSKKWEANLRQAQSESGIFRPRFQLN